MSRPTNTTTPTVPTALTGDAASLVGILDWARGAGVDVSELTVGAVSIKLRSTAGAGGEADERDEEPGRDQQAIYRQFGGELIDRALADKVPGADLQPAIGRRAG